MNIRITYPALGACWLLRPADLEANLVVVDVDDALVVGGDGVVGRGLGNLDAEATNIRLVLSCAIEYDGLRWDVRDLLAVGLLGAEGRPRHGSNAVGKEES